jgi:protein-tyrosine phosphatase
MNPYWITAENIRVAIVPRPRGQDWLPVDIALLRRAGVDVLVSALTPTEEDQLGLSEESECCRKASIVFFSFPIEDRSVPESSASFAVLLNSLKMYLAQGKSIGVHCRAGIGRSSLLAASLLIHSGFSPQDAFDAIEKSRGCAVPDTLEQRNWVERYWNTPKSTPE